MSVVEVEVEVMEVVDDDVFWRDRIDTGSFST
jgi:hypothetical protein